MEDKERASKRESTMGMMSHDRRYIVNKNLKKKREKSQHEILYLTYLIIRRAGSESLRDLESGRILGSEANCAELVEHDTA